MTLRVRSRAAGVAAGWERTDATALHSQERDRLIEEFQPFMPTK